MKIIAVGDFHGEFSEKLKRKILKNDFDIILSNGDFCGNEELSKLSFKYYYGKSKSEVRKIPKQIKNREKKLEKKSIKDGISVLQNLKKLNKPFYAVHGNWDPIFWEWDLGIEEKGYKYRFSKSFHKVFEHNFEFMDFKVKDLGNFVLVGGTSSTHPGMLRKNMVKRMIKKWKMVKKEAEEYVSLLKKQIRRREKKYLSVFQKAKKLNKPIIFLTHNAPYGTSLDLITSKKVHKLAKGQHYGSYLERQMILKFKPDLVICGHIHERFGKDKLGKSLLVNIGSASQGNFVVINFDEKKKKFNVKLIK